MYEIKMKWPARNRKELTCKKQTWVDQQEKWIDQQEIKMSCKKQTWINLYEIKMVWPERNKINWPAINKNELTCNN